MLHRALQLRPLIGLAIVALSVSLTACGGGGGGGGTIPTPTNNPAPSPSPHTSPTPKPTTSPSTPPSPTPTPKPSTSPSPTPTPKTTPTPTPTPKPTPTPTPTPTPPAPQNFKVYNIAMFSDDGNPTPSNGPGELWFGPSSLPAVEKSLFGGYATVSEIGLSPDASDGIAVNGNNALYFFNGANMGSLTVKPTMLTLSQTAGSEHAAVLLSNGDTAVVSLNNNTNQILEVAGLLNYFSTGTLPSITPIATQEDILGLRLSQDSSVLLARGPSVHVFTVSSNPPYMVTKGSTLNPTVNSQVPELDHTVPQLFSQYWGHGGMAISPQNSSVGAVVGLDITTQKPAISLITRLTSVSPNASITDITGMNHAYSVAMSEDGTTAYVGGDTGVAVFSVNKGSLTQVGTVIAPIAGAGPAVLGEITSLAATLDGTNLLVEGTTTPQLSPLGGAASLNNYIEALPLAADIPGAMPSTFQNDIPLTGTDLLETH